VFGFTDFSPQLFYIRWLIVVMYFGFLVLVHLMRFFWPKLQARTYLLKLITSWLLMKSTQFANLLLRKNFSFAEA